MNRREFKNTMLVALLSLGFVSLSVYAKSDKQIMGKIQKAHELERMGEDHAQYLKPLSDSEIFLFIN